MVNDHSAVVIYSKLYPKTETVKKQQLVCYMIAFAKTAHGKNRHNYILYKINLKLIH